MFSKIERRLAGADLASVIDLLARTTVDMVPGAEMAGVTVGRGGLFSTRAATDEAVWRVDRLQYDAGTGPCVDAIIQDTTFNTPDLRTDRRWPQFGQAAYDQTGVVSMLSFRMFFEAHDDIVAGLNIYSRECDAFGEASEEVGMLLATQGALAVGQVVAREKAENLEIALHNSREIGIAMGIVMQNYEITRDDAFNILRMASQATHRKVADIAAQVAETGELPPPPKRSR